MVDVRLDTRDADLAQRSAAGQCRSGLSARATVTDARGRASITTRC